MRKSRECRMIKISDFYYISAVARKRYLVARQKIFESEGNDSKNYVRQRSQAPVKQGRKLRISKKNQFNCQSDRNRLKSSDRVFDPMPWQ